MKQPRSNNLSPLGKYLWEKRFSDSDFAAKMETAGRKVSPSTVRNWRYGTRTPSGENLKAISVLTGLTVGQILGLEAA